MSMSPKFDVVNFIKVNIIPQSNIMIVRIIIIICKKNMTLLSFVFTRKVIQ